MIYFSILFGKLWMGCCNRSIGLMATIYVECERRSEWIRIKYSLSGTTRRLCWMEWSQNYNIFIYNRRRNEVFVVKQMTQTQPYRTRLTDKRQPANHTHSTKKRLFFNLKRNQVERWTSHCCHCCVCCLLVLFIKKKSRAIHWFGFSNSRCCWKKKQTDKVNRSRDHSRRFGSLKPEITLELTKKAGENNTARNKKYT